MEGLSERKKKILRIVVDEYIETAQPVSSKAIAENHLTEISSATVRNELAALEEQGYLIQYHTSGGRVPSPKAYKTYIESLSERGGLTEAETGYIRETFERRAENAESVVKSVADVISELTDYTSVALADPSGETIRSIGLFPCGDKALVVLVTDMRILKDAFISLPPDMAEGELAKISATLQSVFGGRRMDDARAAEQEAMRAFTSYRRVCREALDALLSYAGRKDVVFSGGNKSLLRPEYNEGGVKEFLSLVESREKIAGLLEGDGSEIRIQLKIGSDGMPEDCSMVTAHYSAGDKRLGTFGVLGPVRMDYAKVVSVLESVGKILEKMSEK